MTTSAPLTASADLARELPADPAARLDRVTAAVASLEGERRRCDRLGLEIPLARVDAQLRYWRFVGALFALESPRTAMKRREPKPQGPGALRLVPGSATPAPAASDHPSQWSRPHVRSLAIASGKGGVGKSTLAANLAMALGERGARVLLVDADFSQANLDLLLGVHPRWDLQHVLQGEKSLEEIVVEGPHGVRLVPAASGAPELIDLDEYRLECLWRGMSQLENDADVVLIDTASGLHRSVTWLCRAAREVLVVTTPEMPAFSDAYALIKLLHQQGLTQPPHLVVNRADGAEEAEEVSHRLRLVARRFLSLDLSLWGSVPADPAVARALRVQQPLLTAFPQAPASAAIRALSEHLWDVVPPDPRVQPDTQPQRLEA